MVLGVGALSFLLAWDEFMYALIFKIRILRRPFLRQSRNLAQGLALIMD